MFCWVCSFNHTHPIRITTMLFDVFSYNSIPYILLIERLCCTSKVPLSHYTKWSPLSKRSFPWLYYLCDFYFLSTNRTYLLYHTFLHLSRTFLFFVVLYVNLPGSGGIVPSFTTSIIQPPYPL